MPHHGEQHGYNFAIGDAAVYSLDGGTTFEWSWVLARYSNIGGTGYVDPALAWEAAWTWVQAQGGGKLTLRGPGENWVALTQINSQGGNINITGSMGLTIELADDVDDTLLDLAAGHDYIILEKLRLLGNGSGQGGGPSHCLNSSSDHATFRDLILEEGYTQCFKLYECHDVTIDNCRALFATNNDGFLVSAGCYDIKYDNSDGFACNGQGFVAEKGCYDVTYTNCHAHHMDGTAEENGFGIEHGGVATPYNIFYVNCTSYENDGDGWGIGDANGVVKQIYLNNCGAWGNDVGLHSLGEEHTGIHVTGGTFHSNTSGDFIFEGVNGSEHDAEHTLTGVDTFGTGRSVYITNMNEVTISGGDIEGINWGVRLSDTDRINISGPTIRVTSSSNACIEFNDADDLKVTGALLLHEGTGDGIRGLDGNDPTIAANRIIAGGNAIDINNAAVVRAAIGGMNNLTGSGAGCVDGAAIGPQYGNNIDSAGVIRRDVVPP